METPYPDTYTHIQTHTEPVNNITQAEKHSQSKSVMEEEMCGLRLVSSQLGNTTSTFLAWEAPPTTSVTGSAENLRENVWRTWLRTCVRAFLRGACGANCRDAVNAVGNVCLDDCGGNSWKRIRQGIRGGVWKQWPTDTMIAKYFFSISAFCRHSTPFRGVKCFSLNYF